MYETVNLLSRLTIDATEKASTSSVPFYIASMVWCVQFVCRVNPINNLHGCSLHVIAVDVEVVSGLSEDVQDPGCLFTIWLQTMMVLAGHQAMGTAAKCRVSCTRKKE